MQNYEVKLEHVGKSKSDPFGQKQWGASVRFDDGSGMCYFGETPQAALSGLAMYWAQNQQTHVTQTVAREPDHWPSLDVVKFQGNLTIPYYTLPPITDA